MRMSVSEYKKLQLGGSQTRKKGNDPTFESTLRSLMDSRVDVSIIEHGCRVRLDGALMPSLNKVLRWHPVKEYYAYNKAMREVIQVAVAQNKIGRLSDDESYVLVGS